MNICGLSRIPHINTPCFFSGHNLKDCPTNIDPNYDTAPRDGYVCSFCGAVNQHYTTVCPRNRNPDSWTQRRINASLKTNSNESNSHLPRDRLSLADPERLAKRTDAVHVDSMQLDQTAVVARDVKQSDPTESSRVTKGKRSILHDQAASDSSPNFEREECRFPPLKRSRLNDRPQLWSQENGNDRGMDLLGDFKTTKSCGSSRDASVATAPGKASREQSNCNIAPARLQGTGLFSYWDDEYMTISSTDEDLAAKASSFLLLNSSQPGFPTPYSGSQRTRDPSFTLGSRADLQLKSEIMAIFPSVNSEWLSDMASFDVDVFFQQMDEFMKNRQGHDFGGRDLTDLELGEIVEPQHKNEECGVYFGMRHSSSESVREDYPVTNSQVSLDFVDRV